MNGKLGFSCLSKKAYPGYLQEQDRQAVLHHLVSWLVPRTWQLWTDCTVQQLFIHVSVNNILWKFWYNFWRSFPLISHILSALQILAVATMTYFSAKPQLPPPKPLLRAGLSLPPLPASSAAPHSVSPCNIQSVETNISMLSFSVRVCVSLELLQRQRPCPSSRSVVITSLRFCVR